MKYEEIEAQNKKDAEDYYKSLSEKVAPEGLELIKTLDSVRETHLKAFLGMPNPFYITAQQCFFDIALVLLNKKIEALYPLGGKDFPKIKITKKVHKNITDMLSKAEKDLTPEGYGMLKKIWLEDTPFFFGLLDAFYQKEVYLSNFMVSHYNLYSNMASVNLLEQEKKNEEAEHK